MNYIQLLNRDWSIMDLLKKRSPIFELSRLRTNLYITPKVLTGMYKHGIIYINRTLILPEGIILKRRGDKNGVYIIFDKRNKHARTIGFVNTNYHIIAIS